MNRQTSIEKKCCLVFLEFIAQKLKEAGVSNCSMSGTSDCSLLQEVLVPQTLVCSTKPICTSYQLAVHSWSELVNGLEN